MEAEVLTAEMEALENERIAAEEKYEEILNEYNTWIAEFENNYGESYADASNRRATL